MAHARKSSPGQPGNRSAIKGRNGESYGEHSQPNYDESPRYAPVTGLKMYYEIEGPGDPLVFIPPAFGFAGLQSFPALLESHTVLTQLPHFLVVFWQLGEGSSLFSARVAERRKIVTKNVSRFFK